MHFAKSDAIFNKRPQCTIYSIIHLLNQRQNRAEYKLCINEN